MTEVKAEDRLHIKYCQDPACRIERPEDPGDACLNMDHLLRRVAKESETPDGVVKTSPSADFISSFSLTLDLKEEVGDTSNPNLPGVTAVRPERVRVLAYLEDEVWVISLVAAIGPRVSRSSGNLTKRHHEIPFVDPLASGACAPDWTVPLCRFWENRLNGRENV